MAKDLNEEVLGLKPDFQPYPDGMTYDVKTLTWTLHDATGKPVVSWQRLCSNTAPFMDIRKYATPEQLERWKGRWTR